MIIKNFGIHWAKAETEKVEGEEKAFEKTYIEKVIRREKQM